MRRLTSLLAAPLALALGGCLFPIDRDWLDGDFEAPGPRSQRTLDMPAFRGVSVSGGLEVELTVDPNHQGEVELLIEGPEDQVDSVFFYNQGELMVFTWGDFGWPTSPRVTVRATVPPLNQLLVAGGSELSVSGLMEEDRVTIDASGGSEVVVGGWAEEGWVSASGGSTVEADQLALGDVEVWLSGGSEVDLCSQGRVYGVASGGSELVIECGGEDQVEASGGSEVRSER